MQISAFGFQLLDLPLEPLTLSELRKNLQSAFCNLQSAFPLAPPLESEAHAPWALVAILTFSSIIGEKAICPTSLH
jgi:hypothetical protein